MIHALPSPPDVAVILLLLVAAVVDFRTFIIPNSLCFAVLALLPVAWGWGTQVPTLASSVTAFGVTATMFGMLWHLGRTRPGLSFGGGDWKLLSALAPWVGIGGLCDLLLATALAGGVETVVLVVLRGAVRDASPLRRSAWAGPALSSCGVPYGVSIAAGGILGILEFTASHAR